jgi:death-on-curing protein
MPRFLTMAEVCRIHDSQLDEFGGQAGVRDNGLLEAAIAMPMARFGDQFLHDDLGAMAGAYLFHISRNHCFIDGNKRAATAAAVMFLRLNGVAFHVPPAELIDISLAVATGAADKAQAIAFFRKHVEAER